MTTSMPFKNNDHGKCRTGQNQTGVLGSDTFNEYSRIITTHRGTHTIVNILPKDSRGMTRLFRNKTIQVERDGRLDDSGSNIRNMGCRVLSVTRSRLNSNLLYMLLSCVKLANCYRVVVLVRLGNFSVVGDSLELCEKHEGQRQIITGPCVKQPRNPCLYSINNAIKIFIYLYTEEHLMEGDNSPDSMHTTSYQNANQMVCSFYQGEHLLCLCDAVTLCSTTLHPHNMYIQVDLLDWNMAPMKGVTDIMFVANTSELLVILGTSVKVVALDFSNKIVEEEVAFKIKATAAVWNDGDIIVHGRAFDGHFFRCSAV